MAPLAGSGVGVQGGMAGRKRKHLTSLRDGGSDDGEAMVLCVTAGAGARLRRLAVVIIFLGRGCFEGRVVEQGEEKAAEVVRLLLLFDSLCLL